MGAYFNHWLQIGQKADPDKVPKLFHVNWFRKDSSGKFLWPGFGENSRVLAWIFRRCEGKADAVETPAGLVPAPARGGGAGWRAARGAPPRGGGGPNPGALDVGEEQMRQLLEVEPGGFREE